MTEILTLLAVARVTRLITTDVLTEPLRNWTVRRLLKRDPEHMLAYLLVCDWCASVYVGGAAAGAWYAWGETMPFMAITLALAASYATGWLASLTQAGD